MLLHDAVQHSLSMMTVGRVANVMTKGQHLNKIGVQTQCLTDRPANLAYLNRVGKPISKMIRVVGTKNLGLLFKASECFGMNDTIPIALVVGTISMPSL